MTTSPLNTPVPNPLLQAISAVMGKVHGLKKDEKNSHGGYNYVSVDSFKELMRPLLAEAGLSVSMDETSFELVPLSNSKGGETMYAKISYAFVIHHLCGLHTEPENATIVLPLTGAQTAGAAKSYVLKEFMKGRFMVATGDKDLIQGGADADAQAQQDVSTVKGKSAYQARKDGTDKEFTRIMAGLNTIEAEGSMEDLVLFWKTNNPKIKEMPVGWIKDLTEKKDELKAAFEEGENRPLGMTQGGDHDPNTGEIIEPDTSGDR